MTKTVLIVDDDDVLRKSLARGLRNQDFDVIGADSAETATKILERVNVDAMILDRMMGGVDGLTFLKQRRMFGDNTPVIMLTAMSGAENAIDGLSGGADDYLSKPFQLRELILRLQNITKKRIEKVENHTNLPDGLVFADNEFMITNSNSAQILYLSGEEKKLLTRLTSPVGNIAAAAPMVAKRLRGKLNCVLSNIDILTIRGKGYKLVVTETAPSNTNG